MRYNTVKLGDYLYIKGRIGWKGLKKNEYLEKSNYRIINGESLTDDGIDWDTNPEDSTSILNNNNLRILEKGNFVILDLEELAIFDIDRYTSYLKRIGYENDKILDFRSNYFRMVRKR